MAVRVRLESRILAPHEIGETSEKTVNVARVAKVVKGGRRFSFSALVAAGDGKGRVGFGLGKAGEVPDALRKASDRARKQMIKVPLRQGTIPHDVVGEYGPTRVIMKPASPGTGVIAGSAVRTLAELAGIHNIRTKVIGSSNPHNVIQATLRGFLNLMDPESVASMRGISLEELGYHPY